MEALFAYSLKLSVCLGMVYLFYYVALRKLTFYTWNRWFLLLGTLLSFLIPLVNIIPLLEKQAPENLDLIIGIPTVGNLTSFVRATSSESSPVGSYFFNLILLLFALGFIIQGGKLLMQLISFFRIARSASQVAGGAVKIYQVNHEIAPFSFGNAIFLNQNLHQPAELSQIIKHEMVHVTQKHTLDVMWLEVLCLVNWFNPFTWLLRRAVRQNLEFIVDQEVLHTSGLDRKYYQYLLLKVTALPNLQIVNQFNFSSLKTRIIMMNKTPSKNQELVKFLFLFPLMALLLLACQDNFDATIRHAQLKQQVPPPPPPEPKIPAIPPPPPPMVTTPDKLPADQKAFLQRNPQIEVLGWQGDKTMVIFLKSGAREEYDLNTISSREKAEKKYGKLPQAPPPPPEIK